ncbi:MAG TPA: hypothetical protein VMU19_13065, partial [Bryobacteraceae bacterium]|nr:hypothetical protein [Bryobacteraceae bacterium]
MRAPNLFFVLFAGGLTLAPAAFAAEQASEIVDKIVAGEQQFLDQMKDQQPVLEAYIQQMTPADTVLRDDYMLMRLDMATNVDKPITESSDFHKPFFRLDFTGHKLWFRPAGFVRMAFVDLKDFTSDSYQFEYLRREFLGDVRCLVFQVTPRNPGDGSRFLGDIWVDDDAYRIVRFNGTFTDGKTSNLYFHFDSWRVNTAPNVWLPAYVYVEEGNQAPDIKEKYRLKARVMFWGYGNKPGSRLDELSEIHIDSPNTVDDKQASGDMLPLQSQREWEGEAEQNVLDKLERSGLLAPKGDVDKVLDTVVRNLEVTNHLDLDAHCRVLLTTPMESFSMYRTIV